MSAMSASSGLMPLSLISEHKAAQGGPPPVQPLSFASEKHSLVQAPKPTPNGMEPSPPLVPVMPPPQPEALPSLPCGGVSDLANEEERSGGAVPEVQPLEPPSPTVPAVPEQQPATEPTEPASTPEPAASKATPAPSSPQQPTLPSSQGSPPESAVSLQIPPPIQPSQSQPASAVPSSVSSLPQTQDTAVAQAKPQSAQADSTPEQATPDSDKPVQPEAEANQLKASVDPPADKQKSESHNEPPSVETTTAQQQPKPEPPATTTQAATPAQTTTSSGRVSKRIKNPSSVSEKKNTPAPVVNAAAETENGDDKKAKRKRLPTQVYQSPIPELNIIAKMSKIDKNAAAASDDKLIVFYRNEFLAVRNAEGSFYVCQAMQNVYKTSSRIRIRWLSQVANTDHYSPDFYDNTEFDCILTNLNLERIEKNKYRLPDIEAQRTQSILKRAIDAEKGIAAPEEATVTEEHPDGLDLSLYRNEEQLKKRKKSSRNKINKKKVKKAIETESVKKNRDSVRRKPVVEPPKKATPIVNTQKRVVRVAGKIEKPVVQRIVAAKQMGRRKPASSPVVNKAAPVAQPVKEVAKKKEVARGAQLKRKSTEPQPAAVPEKKVKTGASKTRNL